MSRARTSGSRSVRREAVAVGQTVEREASIVSDVVVVGGGVMGLMAARTLRGRGLDVLLLERDQPGRQASWASARHHRQDPARRGRSVSGAHPPERAPLRPAGAGAGRRDVGRHSVRRARRPDPAVTEQEAAELADETRRLKAEGQGGGVGRGGQPFGRPSRPCRAHSGRPPAGRRPGRQSSALPGAGDILPPSRGQDRGRSHGDGDPAQRRPADRAADAGRRAASRDRRAGGRKLVGSGPRLRPRSCRWCRSAARFWRSTVATSRSGGVSGRWAIRTSCRARTGA